MQISVGELIAQIEKGEVEADRGLRALFDGLAATFGGVSEAMINTMSGAFDFLIKTIQGAADKIFNSFNIGTQISIILQDIGAAIQRFTANLSQEDVQNFFNSVIEVGEVYTLMTQIASFSYGHRSKFKNFAVCLMHDVANIKIKKNKLYEV